MTFLGWTTESEIETPEEYEIVPLASGTGYEKALVQMCDIAGYFDELWSSALDIWKRYRRWGLPHGTWAEESEVLLLVMAMIDDEYAAYTAYEKDTKHGNQ